MKKLADYTLSELFAMKDLFEQIDELLEEYVTRDFKETVGLYDLEREIVDHIQLAIKEDEENA